MTTVATQWGTSKADVTPAAYTLTGPFIETAGPECTTPAPTPVLVGTQVHYCLTKAVDATLSNPLQVVVNLPGQFVINDLLQLNFGGPQPTCSGVGTSD